MKKDIHPEYHMVTVKMTDGTEYQTDAMRNQQNILQAGSRDLAADRENQRSMKANLMKTNLSLVHDEGYIYVPHFANPLSAFCMLRDIALKTSFSET